MRLAPHFARRTNRLTNWLKRIALALGGEAGARLTTYLGIAVSGDTLLRILHKLPLPTSPISLHAVGIDDWAWRKGDSYGTIICDLVSKQVIDVLPDCEQDTIKTWLKVYPSLQFVSRDRSVSFAKAIREGAPQATQIADRWHVLKNVREACQKVLSSHRTGLAFHPSSDSSDDVQTQGKGNRQVELNRQKRLVRYQEVVTLYHRGLSHQAIADIIGLNVETVGSWIRAGCFPERQQRPVGSKSLQPYLAYIHQRWDEGCHNATQIWREICQQGYDRSVNTVRGYVARLRQGLPVTAPNRTVATPKIRRYTPYQASCLLAARPDHLKPRQAQDLLHMRQFHSDIETAYQLLQRFHTMARELDASGFHSWMCDAL